MRLPADLLSALNDQTTLERYSSAVYLALAAQFERLSLTGFAAWARRASAEETGHAGKFFDYLADRNETPLVDALDAPPAGRGDPLALVQAALEQERVVSEALRQLYGQAEALQDPPTCGFLLPFLAEQVQSERELTELAARLQLAAGNGAALLLLDHEIGEGEA